MADAEIGRWAAGPLVRLHITPSRTIWRIGPAWSVLAGALAAGAPLLVPDALFRLAAAALLADLLWGVLRQFVPVGQGPTLATAAPAILPYARADAPLAAFLAGLSGREGDAPPRAAWQALLLGLALVAAVSTLLGPAAMLLSLIALLILSLMRGWARRTGGAAFGDALLDVALPWLLGASLAGLEAVSWTLVALAGAFSLLHWGVLRGRARGVALAWMGQGAVLGVLVALRQPWALAGVVILLAPPAWWLASPWGGGLIRALPWWWGAMLIAALAVR